MTQAQTHIAGQCRCGETRLEVTAGPIMTAACHCTGCQRMTGSAFSVSSLFPADAFRVTKGQPVIGGLHGPTRHYHCPNCLSWMFTRPEGLDEFVNIRATMLDDAQSFKPFIETYTDEMLPWATTGAHHSYARFPEMHDFPALMQEFARQAG